MAGETYYFLFSIMFVEFAALFLVNLFYLRIKGKTSFGLVVKSGTPEHKRVMKLASNRSIVVTLVLLSLLIANLVYDVQRLLHLEDQEYARAMLTYGPIGIVLFSILMFFIVRGQHKNFRARKHE